MAKKMGVLLFGGSGRMGQAIQNVLRKSKNMQLLGCVSRLGKIEAPRMNPRYKIVAIDFTSPKGFRRAVAYCTKEKIPLVTGTTGLTALDFRALKTASSKIPILWSANMSIGVQVLLNIIEVGGPAFSGFDISIEETHHMKKKDSPSGTAKILKNAIEMSAKKKNVKIKAYRKGKVVGEHKIFLNRPGEVIYIGHNAKDREIFARGAVQAAEWLLGKKRGLYEMRDLIRDE